MDQLEYVQQLREKMISATSLDSNSWVKEIDLTLQIKRNGWDQQVYNAGKQTMASYEAQKAAGHGFTVEPLS